MIWETSESVRAELVEALSFCFFPLMGFWAYMLHCADRSFYVGHTDDLDARIGTHQSGLIKGYTSTRLPVTLVWADEFPTRYEALQAERQIKGWSRAKKLALIRGDWKLISALGRNAAKKERASTGSARTDRGELARRSPTEDKLPSVRGAELSPLKKTVRAELVEALPLLDRQGRPFDRLAE